MESAFQKFPKNKNKIIDGIDKITDIYYKKFSIIKLEKKFNRNKKLFDFLLDSYNECIVVKDHEEIYEEDIYEKIEELNELDKLEKSNNEIYIMDLYQFDKYRCWIYKSEIWQYIEICLYKMTAIKKAINLHNINVGITLAFLRNNN